MAYRRLLALIDDSPGLNARLDCAAGLAAEQSARVTGLHIKAPPLDPTIGEAQVAADALDRHQQRCEAQANRLHAAFETRLAAHTPAPQRHWLVRQGMGFEAASSEGLYHDLIVAPQEPGEDERLLGRASPGELVLAAARPVLILPAAWRATDAPSPPALGRPLFRHIAVAWNGKREGARAVVDALPLLQAAEDVIVMTVDRDAEAAAEGGISDRLAAYLQAQGCHAVAERLESPGGRVIDGLLAGVAVARADLIVMGGYAHSRLRELFLGGMTRRSLERSPVPLLMSH